MRSSDPAPPRSAPSPRGGSAALAVAAGILLSRLSGLARERVFAHFLGNSIAAGAFKAAVRIPNLLQNLFGEGVLSASFIPVYSRLLAEGRAAEARQLANVIASLLFVVVALLVALGTLGAPILIAVIAPGFSSDARALTTSLVEIMFSGVGLLVLGAWCLGVLNSHRRFFIPYVAPVLWNVVQIGALVTFGWYWARGAGLELRLVHVAAWATVAGAACQLAVQLPSALRLVGGLRPSLALSSGGARRVLGNFAPVVLSRGVVQISAYVDQILASYLGAAAVAAMAYAQQLYLLPVSLFGMAISAAELPAMSSAIGSRHDIHDAVRGRAAAAVRRMAFFVIPSALSFVLLGDVIVAALYQTGRFGARDTAFVWAVLAASALGLVGATRGRVYSSALYALEDPRTPLRMALVRVTLSASVGWALALPLRKAMGWPPVYGAAALSAASSLASWIEYQLLQRAFARRVGQPTGIVFRGRVWLASLLACGLALGVHRLRPFAQPLLEGGLVLVTCGSVYLASGRLLGLPEARAIFERLHRTR